MALLFWASLFCLASLERAWADVEVFVNSGGSIHRSLGNDLTPYILDIPPNTPFAIDTTEAHKDRGSIYFVRGRSIWHRDEDSGETLIYSETNPGNRIGEMVVASGDVFFSLCGKSPQIFRLKVGKDRKSAGQPHPVVLNIPEGECPSLQAIDTKAEELQWPWWVTVFACMITACLSGCIVGGCCACHTCMLRKRNIPRGPHPLEGLAAPTEGAKEKKKEPFFMGVVDRIWGPPPPVRAPLSRQLAYEMRLKRLELHLRKMAEQKEGAKEDKEQLTGIEATSTALLAFPTAKQAATMDLTFSPCSTKVGSPGPSRYIQSPTGSIYVSEAPGSPLRPCGHRNPLVEIGDEGTQTEPEVQKAPCTPPPLNKVRESPSLRGHISPSFNTVNTQAHSESKNAEWLDTSMQDRSGILVDPMSPGAISQSEKSNPWPATLDIGIKAARIRGSSDYVSLQHSILDEATPVLFLDWHKAGDRQTGVISLTFPQLERESTTAVLLVEGLSRTISRTTRIKDGKCTLSLGYDEVFPGVAEAGNFQVSVSRCCLILSGEGPSDGIFALPWLVSYDLQAPGPTVGPKSKTVVCPHMEDLREGQPSHETIVSLALEGLELSPSG